MMSKKVAAIIISIGLVVAVISRIRSEKDESAIQLGKIVVSRSGMLSIKGQSVQHQIVPVEKFPAQLHGLSIIDCKTDLYVARFFEPGGIGVEGYFDVCFELRDGVVFLKVVNNAASVERMEDETTHVRSCSYMFDSVKRVLLKLEPSNVRTEATSIVLQPNRFGK